MGCEREEEVTTKILVLSVMHDRRRFWRTTRLMEFWQVSKHSPRIRRSERDAVSLLLLAALILAPACQQLPSVPAETRRGTIRGVTLVDWSPTGYGRPQADSALQSIVSTGASHIAVIVTAYQKNPFSNTVRFDSLRTPSVTAIRHVLHSAAGLGLKTTMKPHVDIDDGSWRGYINPPNPDSWFASYRSFILPLASLAESLGVAQFIVGTELASTISSSGEWMETIARVRSVFSGSIIYAASWDEAARVPFWIQLDYVGVNFYFPVAQRTDPGRFEIFAGWQPWIERLHLLQNLAGKRIILTEIGYRSVDGAGLRPYDFTSNPPLDLQEQADLYWAAMQAIADQEWIEGLYWWDWRADGTGGPLNKDFTPAGKPAQLELEKSWNP